MASSFFSSRCVHVPNHVHVPAATLLSRGSRAAGGAAGPKPLVESRAALALGAIATAPPHTAPADRFPTNAPARDPGIASRRADTARLRAIVANSGGSNTGDGQRGLDTARATQALAAELLDLRAAQVGVASTGVIGTELPRERMLTGLRAAGSRLGEGADRLPRAILTSDRGPKRTCVEVQLRGGMVRIAAQAKGAGMISPRFATMFCFLQTDAALSAQTVDLLTAVCVKRSFDRISVDGQLSTSDTVFVLANGAAGVEVEAESDDEFRLGEAMDAVMRQLALQIVADGEGARRVGRIMVSGDEAAVEPVARAVADSPLVKTALHGGDPNFGRILQAAGMAYAGPHPFVADLEIEGQLVVSAGEAVIDDLRALDPLVASEEVEYRLRLPGSGGECELFFSDLSPEYVVFNYQYTS